MRVVTVCVGRPAIVRYRGREVQTGIYKVPVDGPRMVRRMNMDGDEQADLRVHGGIDKAVYAFPSEHYEYYRKLLQRDPFDHGQFGENLTTAGMLESEVRIGDRYSIGDTLLEVSQPRSPCYKFGMKMGTAEAVKLCLQSARTGFYFRVLREGPVQAGDAVELQSRNTSAPTVEETHRACFLDKQNVSLLQSATRCAALTSLWRAEFEKRLSDLDAR